SRRRHTRSYGDWSSDVCSSDLDADVLLSQFQRLRRALPTPIEIYYSIKANPHPSVISVFVQQGAGCEIASGGEYALARRAGAPQIGRASCRERVERSVGGAREQ